MLTFFIGKSRNKKKKKSKAEDIAELANKEKNHYLSDDGDRERSSTSVKKTAAELAFEKAQEKRVR